MDDLAHRLGISKRTLYEHFSSKAEILDALIVETFADVDAKTEQILQNDQLSLIEKIKGVITALPTHYEFYDTVILDQIKRFFPEQYAKVANIYNDDWEELHGLIEQGIRDGVIINKNATLIVKMIMEAVRSVQDQRFYMQNNISVSEAISQITDIILFGLVPIDKR